MHRLIFSAFPDMILISVNLQNHVDPPPAERRSQGFFVCETVCPHVMLRAGPTGKGDDWMIVKCPMCRKETPWEGNPFRPFCSERCKMLDLGAWATEEYRIAGGKARDDDGEKEDAS